MKWQKKFKVEIKEYRFQSDRIADYIVICVLALGLAINIIALINFLIKWVGK